MHNGNVNPSVPLAYAAHMNKTYNNMKMLLKYIHYSKYNWNIYGDLKVIALILGLQLA